MDLHQTRFSSSSCSFYHVFSFFIAHSYLLQFFLLNFVCRSSTTKIVSICVQFISTQIKVIIQIFLNFSVVLHLYYVFTTSQSCSKFERMTHRLIININFHSIDSFIRLHSEIPMRHIHHNLHYASSLRPFVHLKLCI